MNTADKLRQEMAYKMPFTKEELIAKVVDRIKNNGYYAYFWGRSTSLLGNEVNNDSVKIVEQWIKEEGFTIERSRNYFGVPEFYVTL